MMRSHVMCCSGEAPPIFVQEGGLWVSNEVPGVPNVVHASHHTPGFAPSAATAAAPNLALTVAATVLVGRTWF
jgi:hypothetical protein